MRKPTGVVLSNATIDELLDYPDALTCLVGLVGTIPYVPAGPGQGHGADAGRGHGRGAA